MKPVAVVGFFCLTLFGCIDANLLNLVRPVTESTPEAILTKWQGLDKTFRSTVDTIIQQVLPMLVRASSEVDLSTPCQGALFKLILAVRQLKPWAVQMMDSFGKMPSGLLSGTVSDLGSYNECLGIKVIKDYPAGELEFQGQYCPLEIRPAIPAKNKKYRFTDILKPLDNLTSLSAPLQFVRSQAQFFYFISLRIGACLPSVCSKKDVENIGGSIGAMMDVYVTVGRCEIDEPVQVSTDQIVMMCIVAGLVLLCAVGTALDVRSDSNTKSTEKVKESNLFMAITSFSVRKNVSALMNTNLSNDAIPILHGLKFLSITWIMVGHTYLYLNWQLLRGLTKAKTIVASFAFQTIANAFVSVDSFFFASGILISYLTITFVDKRGPKSFNVPIFIFKRFWRFLPSTAMLIGLTVLLPFFGSGPLWHESIDVLVDNCRKNWWANLLFINNFLYSTDSCQGTTWYTACDVQLYFMSIIYLLLVYKSVKHSYFFLGFMILGSVISTMVVNYWQDLPPALLMASPDPEGIFDYWYYAHFLPHVHLGPYAIGLALGYILARHRDFRLPNWMMYAGWCVATISSTTVLYSTYLWNESYVPNVWESLIYSGLHRSCWIVGVAWMTYACTTGFGGVVTTILSWKGFVPLSRLTFLAYLWHGTIIFVYMGNLDGGLEMKHVVVVWMFLGHLVVTYALAFVFYVLYEAPFNRLEKIMLGRFMAPLPKKEITTVNGEKVENNRVNGNKYNINGSNINNGVRRSVSRPASEPATAEFVNESFVYKL